jgi:hypothetical protein
VTISGSLTRGEAVVSTPAALGRVCALVVRLVSTTDSNGHRAGKAQNVNVNETIGTLNEAWEAVEASGVPDEPKLRAVALAKAIDLIAGTAARAPAPPPAQTPAVGVGGNGERQPAADCGQP